jgi:hypothetical protein
MTHAIAEAEYGGEQRLLQTEVMPIFFCQAPKQPDGRRYLSFDGAPIPSLPHVLFGLSLRPETTQEEANALAKMINKHCPSLWAQFFNDHLNDDYPDFDEYGLAKWEGPENPRFF